MLPSRFSVRTLILPCHIVPAIAAAVALFAWTCPAPGQISTTRVSVATGGAQGNNWSDESSISNDGRYVAFASFASNLVTGDTNAYVDIFLRDRIAGTTQRISVGPLNAQANGESWHPVISDDGRFVAYYSWASNLVSGDTNNRQDIFVWERSTGITTRVSVSSGGVQGNDHCYDPSISGDGRYVAFISASNNLVPGDTNGMNDAFVYDRQTATISRVNLSSGGVQANQHVLGTFGYGPAISSDGRFVAFSTDASNLVAGDTNACRDTFVHDRQTAQTERVSLSTGGAEANNNCHGVDISGDGRYVVFASSATNLVAGDTNNRDDIFLRDRQTGQTTRVSVTTGGGQAVGGNAHRPSISSDGRYIAFPSNATNLVTGDTNGWGDLFLHDRILVTTSRLNVSTTGTQGNGQAFWCSLAIYGRYASFHSFSTNHVTGDTNAQVDVFVRKLYKLGDLNWDYAVNAKDLHKLQADFGCTGGNCPGDADGDGDTDQDDLNIVRANWDSTDSNVMYQPCLRRRVVDHGLQSITDQQGQTHMLPSQTVTTLMFHDGLTRDMNGVLRRVGDPVEPLDERAFEDEPDDPNAQVITVTRPGQRSCNMIIIFTISGTPPSGATDALVDCGQRYLEVFEDCITINVKIKFKELDPDVIGSSSSEMNKYEYEDVASKIDSTGDSDDILDNHLPSGSTIDVKYDGSTVTAEKHIYLSRPAAKALGLISSTASANDATLKFNTDFGFDFDPTNGIASDEMDFQYVVMHEMCHLFGFSSSVDYRSKNIENLDLFRFSSSDCPGSSGSFETEQRTGGKKKQGTACQTCLPGWGTWDMATGEEDGDGDQASHWEDHSFSSRIGMMDPNTSEGNEGFDPSNLISDYFFYSDLRAMDALAFEYIYVDKSLGAFDLVSPADGATGVALDPTLDWSASTNTDGYRLRVYEAAHPSNVVIDVETSSSSRNVAFGALALNTTYNWCVTSSNSWGSTNSNEWTFTTAASPTFPTPSPFNKSSPLDRAAGVSRRPPFGWTIVDPDRIAGYRFEVAIEPYFIPPIIWQSDRIPPGSPGPFLPIPDRILLNNTQYYWRVMAVNGRNVVSGPTEAFTFTTGTFAPADFGLLGPMDGRTQFTRTPQLEWQAAFEATSYTLEIDNDPQFGSPEVYQADLTDTDFEVPANVLGYNTTYFWRVTANNSAGPTVSTPARSQFTTGIPPPERFSLLGPVQGQFLQTASPTLAWEPSNGATAYLLEIDDDPDFGTPDLFANVLATEFTVPAGKLRGGKQYFWHVTAYNLTGMEENAQASASFALGHVGYVSLKHQVGPRAPQDCLQPGSGTNETLTVALAMSNSTASITGGQFFMEYDHTLLDFLGADPGDAPFTREVFEQVDEGAGTITYATGIENNGTGTSADKTLAVLTFRILAEDCATSSLVRFVNNEPPSRLSTNDDQEVTIVGENLAALALDYTAPILTVPANVSVHSDAGGCSTTFDTLPQPTAVDNCATGIAFAFHRSDNQPNLLDPYAHADSPVVITWTAADECGNTATGTQVITISDKNVLTPTVELSPQLDDPDIAGSFPDFLGDTLTRCLRFELWACPTGLTPAAIVDQTLAFPVDAGVQPIGTGSVLVPCGAYNCLTARDRLHTLRSKSPDFTDTGTTYTATLVGNANSGGHWLTGGNLNDDRFVDILDFGSFVIRFQTYYGTGNTNCATPFFHADITGDGIVFTGDFTFIQVNFLKRHQSNCCGRPNLDDGEQPLQSISVAELWRRGLGELAAADLNGDGMLDTNDMVAFAQGKAPGGTGEETDRARLPHKRKGAPARPLIPG